MMGNNHFRSIANFLFFPIRVILKPDQVRRLGLTPLYEERHNAVLKHVRGRLLDVGCGELNALVESLGKGVGVDVFFWNSGKLDVLVDTTCLPFANAQFDTVTFLANLNHIPASIRLEVLMDAKRVLRDDGQFLITMLTPGISYVGHKILWGWRDPDLHERGMKEGETWGLHPEEVEQIIREAGLKVVAHKTFAYGFNHLYVAEKSNE